MHDRLNAQRNPYTPTSPQLLGPGLRAELEQLDDLTPAQLEIVFAYAAQDGRLVSIIRPTGIMGRGLLHFQTFELATGLTYEHKLEPINATLRGDRRRSPGRPDAIEASRISR